MILQNLICGTKKAPQRIAVRRKAPRYHSPSPLQAHSYALNAGKRAIKKRMLPFCDGSKVIPTAYSPCARTNRALSVGFFTAALFFNAVFE